MAEYESYTRELVLHRYRESKLFSTDAIEKVDLSDIDLRGVRFEDTRIAETFLDRAILSGMSLVRTAVVQSNCNYLVAPGSRIEEAVFSNCTILKSDFTGSSAVGLRMTNCIAHSMDLTGSSVVNAVFTDCQMQKARFERSLVMKVAFRRASLEGLVLLGKTSFSGSMVVDCTFSSVDMSGTVLTGAVFIGCGFNDTVLDEADCSGARFIHCTMNGRPFGAGAKRPF